MNFLKNPLITNHVPPHHLDLPTHFFFKQLNGVSHTDMAMAGSLNI
jgi:hypothetical protein